MANTVPRSLSALDTAISRAESAVVTRDTRLRSQVRDFRVGVRQRASRALAIGGAALAAGALLAVLLARGEGSRRTARLGAGVLAPLVRARRALARVPWARVLPFVWPFVPLRLRSRVPRSMAALLLGLGLPAAIAGRGGACASERDAPRTATGFDLDRYLGHWHEIARMPLAAEDHCAGDVSATYSREGTKLRVQNRCLRDDGSEDVAEGMAVAADPTDDARLKLCFAPAWLRWLPMVWADYWVLHVDADYRCALVGTPDRRHLWLLSRTPALAAADLQRLLDEARLRGYDTALLVSTRPPGM